MVLSNFNLVILDNGRSKALGSEFNDVLRCIRCGACLNTCPVYRQIGGHSYGSVYPGPIGFRAVAASRQLSRVPRLTYACSLCTACNQVCPVKIPLANLLLKHRTHIAEQGLNPTAEKISVKAFTFANSHPALWKSV